MNVFYLSYDPRTCATEHCDKHVVKMIVEYAQLLSTAHRVLDGIPYTQKSPKGVTVKRFRLDFPREDVLYKACHINHPSAVWVRQSSSHYKWLFELFQHCCVEYTRRYGKFHKTESLISYLWRAPASSMDKGWVDPPPAMPDKYKVIEDSIQSYRNYYIGDKVAFATWKSPATPPLWFIEEHANLQVQR
jgi:hypothetical protein